MSRPQHATSSPRSRSAVAFDVLNAPLDGVSLVEASAGTGKTWNICGLFLRLLLERGLWVKDILVVTFTNAATAELRERVRARIADMLAYVDGRSLGQPDEFVVAMTRALETRGVSRTDMRTRLDLALQSFDEAAILTIHGWCQRALALTPFTAGLPFEVDVQPDDTELRLAIVQDFWRRNVADDGCPAPIAAWLETKRVTPESLEKLLRRHLAKPLADVRWPQAIDEPFDLDADALNALFERARGTWNAERDAIIAAATKAGRMKRNVALQVASEWDAWLGRDALAYIKWKDSKLRRFSTYPLAPKSGAASRHPFFDEADALIAARKAAEVKLEHARLRLVRMLFAEAGPALREQKRAARLAAYDDLLQNLHASLLDADGAARAEALRKRFPAALIDEFQDTDPVQFAIFDAIYGAGDASLFLVGDPKQAIYAFRNADLHTYLQAARNVKATSTLTENQRSTPRLVAAINALFGGNREAFMLDGLAYHEVHVGARKRTILDDRSGTNADLCIWRLPRWGDGTPHDRRTALDAAASATAAEISRLLRASAAGQITLDGAPLAPDDIAVLVRSHRQGDDIKRALAALGIGSVELSQATVFKSPDAEDVERVLAAILVPADDGLVRAALATELFGLDATAIATLGDDELALTSHVQRFLAYRESWLESGIGVMYRKLLANEGVATRMLARADGERRLTNLLHLGELLHTAAETHRAPDALLRWLNARRREDAGDDVAQLRLESYRNLVRIATIHKVKGLEYPIVFCPFLWDAFSRARNTIEGREYHDERGRAVVDLRSDDELGAELDAIRDRIRLEASAESVRLFYVAMTRASHRCYVVAGCYARMYKSGPSPKETVCGLLNWLVAGDGMTPEQWLDGKCKPADIDDAWARLGTALAPHAVCSPLSMEPGERVAYDRHLDVMLSAAKPPKRIASPWRISSFSGLHDGAVSEIAASDHDALRAVVATQAAAHRAVAAASSLGDVAADDILRFPRGVGAGDCLHAVLERIDFTASTGWDDAIARALRQHPVSLPGAPTPESNALLRRMIARMIDDVVHTQLPDGIRLDCIAGDKRLVELEFSLPAHHLDARALNDALKAAGYAVDRLTFGQLAGYLRGFIDLVFEHRSRYYVLDWKSNHLGYAPADYSPDALATAMAGHGYHLQALLYSLALTRYLARRVPGYRHGAHFGGVLYLFVRGVRPAWQNADGTAAGVHFHRPSDAMIARLDALLGAASRETAS
jgi:exodeoxyribonuclease V beta subunit